MAEASISNDIVTLVSYFSLVFWSIPLAATVLICDAATQTETASKHPAYRKPLALSFPAPLPLWWAFDQ